MSKRGRKFFDQWVQKNLTAEADAMGIFPRPDNAVWAFLEDADEKGIPHKEIIDEVGELNAAMHTALMKAPRAKPDTDEGEI